MYTNVDIEKHSKRHLIWDRDFIYTAQYTSNYKNKVSKYDKIFIGHTPTLNFENKTKPIKYCEVCLIDTGASYYGPLTLMDVDTEEIWQSKPVNTYYPGIKARGHYKEIQR